MADEGNTAPERTVCLDLRITDRATVSTGSIDPGTELRLVAGVRVASSPGSPSFGSVGVYLVRVDGSGTPPNFSWELRARYGAEAPELVTGASGALSKLTTFAKRGSVVFASRPVTGWELWASHDGAVPIPCGVRFIVGPVEAVTPHATAGELV